MLPRRILVIDDDPYLPRIIELSFGHIGHLKFCYAAGGQQGLQFAEANPPDLILLDYAMPGMDGLETLRRLRAHQRTARTPIVAITGALPTTHRCAEMISGCDAYLPKPFELTALSRVVGAYCRNRNPLRPEGDRPIPAGANETRKEQWQGAR